MDKIAESIARIAAETVPTAASTAGTIPLDLPDVISEALDGWIADRSDPKPSRAEAIRRILGSWLADQGRLQPRDGLDDLR